MTAPRRVIPGATLMITRRCLGRTFLLRPSTLVNEFLAYLLAVTATRYAIRLHAVCVLSNHLHIVLSDPDGRLPEFERDLDCLAARSLNALHGRWETFWAPGSYSAVTLMEPDDVVSKAAYVLTNPVAAGLVRTGAEWPGLRSSPAQIGGAAVTVKRPKRFFREGGPMPETAELVFHCPPGFASAEVFQEQLIARVRALEHQARQKMAARGRSFLGAQRVLAQDPHARPWSGEPRRKLNPRIACMDKWKRLEAIQRLRSFHVAYREAWLAFAGGVREALFPYGTYWMQHAYGVPCAAAG